jgi:hypothetical protein
VTMSEVTQSENRLAFQTEIPKESEMEMWRVKKSHQLLDKIAPVVRPNQSENQTRDVLD